MKKRRRKIQFLTILFVLFIFSCSDDNNVEPTVSNEISAVISNSETELSIYNKSITIDGSNSVGDNLAYEWDLISAPNNFQSYRWECHTIYDDPAMNEYEESKLNFSNTETLIFPIRQIGAYTIRLTVANDGNTSYQDFNFNVTSNIPDFTLTSLYNEPFSDINLWELDEFDYFDFSGVDAMGYDYEPDHSSGGHIEVNNGSMELESGTFVYRSAKQNFNSLSFNSSDNIKISIHTEGDRFSSSFDPTDSVDEVSDIQINFNNYKISFYDETEAYMCSLLTSDLFLKENLANRDIDFYIYYNDNGAPDITVISENLNISERFKIEDSITTDNTISFYVYHKVNNTGSGYNPSTRIYQVSKLEINKFQ